MSIPRRGVISALGSAILASPGCLKRLPSGQTTRDFPVDDLSVHNERDETVEVSVSITNDSESVLEETFALAPDETRTYEDVMANEREYEVTVRADGLTRTETFDEHRDNAGLQFSITPEQIESDEIVH